MTDEWKKLSDQFYQLIVNYAHKAAANSELMQLLIKIVQEYTNETNLNKEADIQIKHFAESAVKLLQDILKWERSEDRNCTEKDNNKVENMLSQWEHISRSLSVNKISGWRSTYVGRRKLLYFDTNSLFLIMSEQLKENPFPNDMQLVYSPALVEELCKVYTSDHAYYLSRLGELTKEICICPFRVNDEPYRLCRLYENPAFSYIRIMLTQEQTKEAERQRILEYKDEEKEYSSYSKASNRKRYNNYADTFLTTFKYEVNQVLDLLKCDFHCEDLAHTLKNYSRLNSRIHNLSRAMNILGFKKDNEQNGEFKKVKSSRQDIEHILYASKADLFVTKDEKMYYRAKNILGALNCGTTVMKWKDYVSDYGTPFIDK